MKILVISEENIYDRKGSYNAFVGRTKHLKSICDSEIDVLLLSTYEPFYIRWLRGTQKHARPAYFEDNGLTMKLAWNNFSLIDYLLEVKLHKSSFFRRRYYQKLVKRLSGYDLIIAHSFNCGMIAKQVKQTYGTPYTVTWHGSDIHTSPFANESSRKTTIEIIEDADINLFVSEALLTTSDKLTLKGRKEVLYNGHDERFFRYSDEERVSLRNSFSLGDKKVVVFVGNFFPVKNILEVPRIFRSVYSKFRNVEFWMVGDGKLRNQVEELSDGLPIRFWGNQSPQKIPDFLNASDVLILPSKNEGLPLSVVEGLACGCNVVGSMVGGIPEVIGKENCIELSEPLFAERFAEKVVKYLIADKHIPQPLNKEFFWDSTAKKELAIIDSIF